MERVFHTWDKWECYRAGMYEVHPPSEGMSEDECRDAYAAFLSDDEWFRRGLSRVLEEWPNSTEHYLTNERMNRIAWLGQAAMCIETRVPRAYRGGFARLTPQQQERADATALEFLNIWIERRGEETLTAEAAKSKTEADLY